MKQSRSFFVIVCSIGLSTCAMEDISSTFEGTQQLKNRSQSTPNFLCRETGILSEEEKRFVRKNGGMFFKKSGISQKLPVSKTRSVSDETVSLVIHKLRETYLYDLPPHHEIAVKESPKKTLKKSLENKNS